MSKEEIERIKYIVNCPMCDNPKCVRKSKSCEAEKWASERIKNTNDRTGT